MSKPKIERARGSMEIVRSRLSGRGDGVGFCVYSNPMFLGKSIVRAVARPVRSSALLERRFGATLGLASVTSSFMIQGMAILERDS